MRSKNFFYLMGLTLFFLGCSNPVGIRNMKGALIQPNDSLSTYLFLNAECPICQKYQGSYKLMNLNQGLVYFVFPGKQDINLILDMCQYDSIDLAFVLLDTDFKLTQNLNASVTPEAVIKNHGQVVYKGLIDDRFSVIGSAKPRASINYIENALNSLHKNEAIKIPYTKAVGCFIEPN